MQETLLHAFKEAQTSSSSNVNSSTSNTSQQQPTRNMITTQFNSIQSSNNSMLPHENAKGAMGFSQGLATTTIAGAPSDATGMTELYSHYPSLEYNVQSSNNDTTDDANNQISTSQEQQNWLSEAMQIIPTLDPSRCMGQFSPMYTSKSFDELHHFIGNDWSTFVKDGKDYKIKKRNERTCNCVSLTIKN